MTTITVYKRRRMLECNSDGRIIFTCEIGLGAASFGHKTHEGDGKTPEGHYTVCTRNEQSKYTLFLGLSYPSLSDAKAGFSAGLISASELDAIALAHQNGLRPPWNTDLGGQIGIHGGGIEKNGILTDNTAGCIALRDSDIRTLWALASIGSRVTILP